MPKEEELFGFGEAEADTFDAGSDEPQGDAQKRNQKGAMLIPPGPWHEYPQLWDVLQMENKDWPGIAKVTVSRAHKWDEKEAKGSHNQTRTYAGVQAAKGTITITFWTSEQDDEITKDFLPMVEPDPTKDKARVLKVGHATFYKRKIKIITVDNVDGPNVEGGLATYTIDWTDAEQPSTKNATGTAKTNQGNKSTGNGQNKARCQDLEAEEQRLRRENDQLFSQKQQNNIALGGSEADAQNLRESNDRINVKYNANIDRLHEIKQEKQKLNCGGQCGTKPGSGQSTTGPSGAGTSP